MPAEQSNTLRLSPRQKAAIACLLSTTTMSEAAKEAKVKEKTLCRWLDDPFFRRAYRKMRFIAFEQAMSQLQINTAEAVETLRSIFTDKEITASSRVSAATNTINIAMKFTELDDLVRRVDALEEKVASRTIAGGSKQER
jgi:hypothetical protein